MVLYLFISIIHMNFDINVWDSGCRLLLFGMGLVIVTTITITK